MPDPWATAEETAFLRSELGAYISAVENKKNKSISRFWNHLEDGWSTRWPTPARPLLADGSAPPPLTDDEVQVAGEKIALLKRRLRDWMRYQHRLTRQGGGSGPSIVLTARSLFQMLRKKSTRPMRQIELYQSLCRDKIHTEVLTRGYAGMVAEADGIRAAALARAKAGGDADVLAAAEARDDVRLAELRSERMSLWRLVSREMYAEESEETREEITEATEAANKGRGSGEEVDDASDAERSPEQLQHGVDQIGGVFAQVHEMTKQETGWFGMTILGGPMPRRLGQISTKTMCFGTTPLGNDFASSVPNLDELLKVPFHAWLKRCFPHDVRDARALSDTDGPPPTTAPVELEGMLTMEPLVDASGESSGATGNALAAKTPATQAAKSRPKPRARAKAKPKGVQSSVPQPSVPQPSVPHRAPSPLAPTPPLPSFEPAFTVPDNYFTPTDYDSTMASAFGSDSETFGLDMGDGLWSEDTDKRIDDDNEDDAPMKLYLSTPADDADRPSADRMYAETVSPRDDGPGDSAGRTSMLPPIDYRPSVLLQAFGRRTPSTAPAALSSSGAATSSSSWSTSAPSSPPPFSFAAPSTQTSTFSFGSPPSSTPFSFPEPSSPSTTPSSLPALAPSTFSNTRPPALPSLPPSTFSNGRASATSSASTARPSALSVFSAAVSSATKAGQGQSANAAAVVSPRASAVPSTPAGGLIPSTPLGLVTPPAALSSDIPSTPATVAAVPPAGPQYIFSRPRGQPPPGHALDPAVQKKVEKATKAQAAKEKKAAGKEAAKVERAAKAALARDAKVAKAALIASDGGDESANVTPAMTPAARAETNRLNAIEAGHRALRADLRRREAVRDDAAAARVVADEAERRRLHNPAGGAPLFITPANPVVLRETRERKRTTHFDNTTAVLPRVNKRKPAAQVAAAEDERILAGFARKRGAESQAGPAKKKSRGKK
ncbi:hypothetical protein C8R47DRAFT_1218989 [Mycena vitilis]|nr:hypothetical protein C8R47DRAFT_1218989 [Mycena vitilis]